MNKKGQSILSEYVMIFFVVIAALTAMTAFVQRGFQARIYDARNFMSRSAANALVNGCGNNCLAATGNTIPYQYEPYYAVMFSDVQHKQEDTTGATTGNAQVLGAVYTKFVNEVTNTGSTSIQLPPGSAN